MRMTKLFKQEHPLLLYAKHIVCLDKFITHEIDIHTCASIVIYDILHVDPMEALRIFYSITITIL